MTHWAGCWTSHHDCAIVLLADFVAAARNTLKELRLHVDDLDDPAVMALGDLAVLVAQYDRKKHEG